MTNPFQHLITPPTVRGAPNRREMRGRPAKHPDEVLHQTNIGLTRAQTEKYRRIGGADAFRRWLASVEEATV